MCSPNFDPRTQRLQMSRLIDRAPDPASPNPQTVSHGQVDGRCMKPLQ